MTFIKEFSGWWELNNHPERGLRAYNYMGGWHDIDENSPSYMNAEICEAEDWHDLYLKKHYDPTALDRMTADMWIAPDGSYHIGDAHTVSAEYIAEIWYGYDDGDMGGCERYIEQKGWIKVSKFFWDMHLETYEAWGGWDMTRAQADTVFDYCQAFKISYPIDLINIIYGV